VQWESQWQWHLSGGQQSISTPEIKGDRAGDREESKTDVAPTLWGKQVRGKKEIKYVISGTVTVTKQEA
jgi:hypothetical protein